MTTAPFDVVRLEAGDSEEWNRLVRESDEGTPFHLFECLDLFSDYSGMPLHLLVGYNGQEPVGVFPVFERSVAFVSTVFSPPPKLKIPYLGPLLVDDHSKGSSRERRRWRFVRSSLDHIRSTIDPTYLHVRTTNGYRDPRPFEWEEYDVQTGFTYVVDLAFGRDHLFERFSRDVRSNVRECEDAGCVIDVGGRAAIRRIVAQIEDRLEERGTSHPLDSTVFETLYERLPDGVVRPYVCTLDGDFIGGNVVFCSSDSVYPWVGAAKPDSALGVNDAVHWRAMEDSIEAGATEYDLVGADDERLSTYKSKFAPELRPVYTIRKRPPYMVAVERVYDRIA